MVKRRAKFYPAIGDLPISTSPGKLKQIIGDNPRRVGLHIECRSVGTLINISEKDGPTDAGNRNGWILQGGSSGDIGSLHFDNPKSCPQNALFAQSTTANPLLFIVEITDEDIG